MPELDLSIISNNQQLIKQLQEVIQAQGQMFSEFSKGAEKNQELWEGMADGIKEQLKEMGVSEDQFFAKFKQGAQQQSGILENLEADLQSYQNAKKKALSPEDITKFNQKIKATNDEIKKLNGETSRNDAGFNKLNKSSGNLITKFDKLKGMFFKVTGIVGVVTGAITGLISIMKKSEQGAEFYERKVVGLKTAFAVLTGELTKVSDKFITNDKSTTKWGTGFVKWIKAATFHVRVFFPSMTKWLDETGEKMNVASAAAENYTRKLQNLEDEENFMIVARAKTNKAIAEAKLLYEDETKSINERIAALESSINMEEETIEAELKHQRSLTAVYQTIYNEKFKIKDNEEEAFKILQQSKAKELDLETQSMIKRRKAQSTLNSARKELERETNEKILKEHEEFLKLYDDLEKAVAEAGLDNLTGRARIDAEEKFNLEQLAIQYKRLQGMRIYEEMVTAIKRKAMLDRLALDKEDLLNSSKNSAETYKLLLSQTDAELELIGGSEKQKLEAKLAAYQKVYDAIKQQGNFESALIADEVGNAIRGIQKEIAALPKSEFSFWKLIGIDPQSNEGRKQIEGIQAFTSVTLDSIGQILDAEAEIAAKRTEQIDDRISNLENQLDQEKSLKDEGLANNFDSLQRQIQIEKQAKEKALQEEKKIQKQKELLDTLNQASSLITASAQIFEATSSIMPPYGQILAIAAIAAMMGTFVAAKVKASQAARMEQGGFIDSKGVVHGKDHQHGGENLSSMVEVREGEFIPVINKPAVSYYGDKQLGHWTNMINKRQFPKFDIRPELKANQVFDLKTGQMNSELKAIKNGIEILNQNLLNQQQVNHTTGTRIERTKNRTRIIHVKD